MTITYRSFRDEHDYEAMTAIRNAAGDACGITLHETVAGMRNLHENTPNFDLLRDMRLAEADRQTVAYGRVRWTDTLAGERQYRAIAHVHPAQWGQGIGRALLQWQEQRAAEIEAEVDVKATRRVMHQWSDERNPRKMKLLTQSGYLPVRYSVEMVRPNSDDIPALQLPPELEIRPITPDQLRAVWDATVEAFQDHWGESPQTEMDYQRWLNEPTLRLDLFKVAFDKHTGEVAGLVQAIMSDDPTYSYINDVATRRKYRKRGVARALLCASLRQLYGLGVQRVGLDVDTENPTGALGVYEACGFKAIHTETTFHKEF